jgi:hypothetical protein
MLTVNEIKAIIATWKDRPVEERLKVTASIKNHVPESVWNHYFKPDDVHQVGIEQQGDEGWRVYVKHRDVACPFFALFVPKRDESDQHPIWTIFDCRP